MPIYEFHCGKCEQNFELLVRSAKWEGVAACPQCGSKKLTKNLSTFASAVAGTTSAPTPAACGMKKRGHGGGCGCC
jgi:putative FmdB family regulatory protein